MLDMMMIFLQKFSGEGSMIRLDIFSYLTSKLSVFPDDMTQELVQFTMQYIQTIELLCITDGWALKII